MKTLVLLTVFFALVGCGGQPFEGVAPNDSTVTDAAPDGASEVDTHTTPPPEAGVGADMGPGEASVAVEASADAGAVEVGSDGESDATADAAPDRDPTVDAWPSDVVVVPYCPDSEVFPAQSPTCIAYASSQGWTVRGCCRSTHACGGQIGDQCVPE